MEYPYVSANMHRKQKEAIITRDIKSVLAKATARYEAVPFTSVVVRDQPR